MKRSAFLQRNTSVLTAPVQAVAAPQAPPTDPPEKVSRYANKTLPAAGSRTTSTLAPYAGAWGYYQAAHLLRRCLFGPTRGEIQAAAALTALFGQSFPYVPVIKPNALATSAATAVADFGVYPNPSVGGPATLAFTSEGGVVQVVIFHGLGREVRRPVPGSTLGAGPQQVPLDLRGLAPGAYHCTVREGSRSSSQLVVVE